MNKPNLILGSEGVVRASEKPSGIYVEVFLIEPVQFRPDEPARPAGDTVVCEWDLADSLSSAGVAAIIYERLDPRVPLMCLGQIRA